MAGALSYTAAQIDALLSAVSGRNLLDNWDFRNPVNQRGQTSYTAAGFAIDRWYSYGATAEIVSDGVRLTATSIDPYLEQRIASPALYAGKTVTASAIINSIAGPAYITIFSFDGVTYTTVSSGLLFQDGLATASMVVPATSAQLFIRLYVSGDSGVATFACAKLELGSVSTLANDPPADYGVELGKCKRYFRKWTTEAARTDALKECDLMRVTPVLDTLVIDGTTYYTASADL